MSRPWISPTLVHPVLYLPKPLISGRFEFDMMTSSPCNIGVPVSEAFVTAWNSGPETASLLSIANALEHLSYGFCDLICACRGQVAIYQKDAAQDYVTDVDIGIEMLLRVWLNRFRPDDRIIGEEGPKDQFRLDDWVWFLDPVDGTSNFIDGSANVSLHIGCLHYGNPIISIVGLPFSGTVLVACDDYFSGQVPVKKRAFSSDRLILGTEYREDGSKENKTLVAIQARLGAEIHRVKSIGVNVIGLLTGELDGFYKPRAKYWDLVAPLGVVYQRDPARFRMSVTYLDALNQPVTRPLFGFEEDTVIYINERHQKNSRIGLVTVVAAESHALEKLIINEVQTCMSLSC